MGTDLQSILTWIGSHKNATNFTCDPHVLSINLKPLGQALHKTLSLTLILLLTSAYQLDILKYIQLTSMTRIYE